MYKTFKTRLNPTKKQRKYFEKCFGVRRWVWNYLWSLNFGPNKEKDYKYKGQNFYSHEFVEMAKNEEYNWLNEVNTMVRTEAIKDFDNCIKKLFKRIKDKSNNGFEVLKPKKKSCNKQSFRIVRKNERVFTFNNGKLCIIRTREKGRMTLRTSENLTFINQNKIKSCTITKENDKYYIYVTYETEKTNLKEVKKYNKIGIDLGIKHIAVCFDGTNEFIYDLPKKISKIESKTDKKHKSLSCKKYNSNRYKKQLIKLRKSYEKENNIKKDFREKVTSFIAKNYEFIVIDDFDFDNAKELGVNRKLLRNGIYKFKQRLEEKNNNVIFIPKFTPTTQICSNCGKMPLNKILLKDRIYKCTNCGFKKDRDLNSAINVFNFLKTI